MNFSKEVLRPCSLSGFRKNKQTKKGREKNTGKKNLQLTRGFQTAQRQQMDRKAKQGAETGGEKQPALYARVSGADRKQKPGRCCSLEQRGEGVRLQGSLNVLGAQLEPGSSAAPRQQLGLPAHCFPLALPMCRSPGWCVPRPTGSHGREGGAVVKLSGPSGCADGTSRSG